MATLGEIPRAGGSVALPDKIGRINPTLVFWIVGPIVYGGVAAYAATGYFLDQPVRDIWQHLAALRALIENPYHPVNPFVPTQDPSRHFNPYWVSMALLARAFGWNEWQALALGAFVNAGVLLCGIFTFARAFYRDRWGPLALIAAMVIGWIMPIDHTGYHSIGTLLEGFAYPAVLLIGLSFNLWALVIRALERRLLLPLIVPLTALMFATHQLGGGIGCITAGCIILLWPSGTPKDRAIAAGAIGAGIFASTLWPYLNPIDAVLRTGNASWTGGVAYYSWPFLYVGLVPQAAGLIGLCRPTFRHSARPILAAFGIFIGLFALGLTGVLIATRFFMPAVLMLHIGLGALLLDVGRHWKECSNGKRLGLLGAGIAVATIYAASTLHYLSRETANWHRNGNAYDQALALTGDIPDMQPVAAYDVAAWPMIATGQRALSEPWPEPGIPDLTARQTTVERLFDPSLTRSERVALAKRWSVRVLIMHEQGPIHRAQPPHQIETLRKQSIRYRRAGPYLRFDLY